jgi:hypothetical protein
MISSALPIQFWSVDEETFNETEVCGINNVCFCQPWQCDDTIVLQFTLAGNYNVGFVDPSGAFIGGYVNFAESDDVQTASFTFEEEQICDQKVQMIIFEDLGYVLEAPSLWADGLTPFNSKTATQFLASLNNNNTRSATQILIVPGGTVIKIPYSITTTNNTASTVRVTMSAGSGFSSVDIVDNTTVTGFFEFTTVVTSSVLTISANRLSSIQPDVVITIVPDQVLYVDPGDIFYKSDCLDVRTSHDCTKLITYSNESDFAGIVYDNVTPQLQFNLRVPAMLFRAIRPQEQRVHALSNDEWIRLWSKMEKKMKLELGFMPDYMHEKIQLILMHDNIEIDSLSWKQRDPYEPVEGNKRNPLFMANVLLTDKDFIKRNLI